MEQAQAPVITDAQYDQIVSNLGGDYLPASENPAPDPVLELAIPVPEPDADPDKPAEAPAAEPEKKPAEPKPEPEEEANEEPPGDTPQPAPETPPKDEHQLDPETERRLRMIEQRDSRFRAEAERAKKALDARAAELEQKFAQVQQLERQIAEAEAKRRQQYKQDPVKALEDMGIPFEAVVAANLKNRGVPVPQELETRLAEAERHSQTLSLKDEFARLLDERLTPIKQTIEQQRAQEERAKIEHQLYLESEDRRRAVTFVEENAEQYPGLALYLDDPDYLAERLLQARQEYMETYGTDGNIAKVVDYYASKKAGRLRQPKQSGKATPPPDRNSDQSSHKPKPTSTLSNDSVSARTHAQPQNQDEWYEQQWQSAGYRG